MSVVTVLLPLVPVTATIGAFNEAAAEFQLANHRDSPAVGFDEQARGGRHAGTRDHQVDALKPGRVFGAEMDLARRHRGVARAATGFGVKVGAKSARRSVITRRAPRAASKRAAASPLTPSPITITRLPARSIESSSTCLFRLSPQRNLSVLSATSPQMIEIIQNRTTTCVSGHPPSSK